MTNSPHTEFMPGSYGYFCPLQEGTFLVPLYTPQGGTEKSALIFRVLEGYKCR